MKTACLLIGAVAYVHGASILQVKPTPVGGVLVAPGVADAAGQAGAGVNDFLWKYTGQNLAASLDPTMWNTLPAASNPGAGVCGTGTSQSPINIITASATTAATDIGAVTTTLFDTNIRGVLVNTGRVLRWMALGTAPTITGGPLATDSIYTLSHIDFHFGSVDTQGSEHQLDGTSSAMEMEMVFWDSTAFSTSALAMASTTDTDALATISQLFNVGTADNAGLAQIVTQIPNVVNADNDGTIPTGRKKREASARQGRQTSNNAFADLSAAANNLVDNVAINIEDIIGRTNIDSYFHYDGSLTEPDCTEMVRWIINKDRATISAAQLTAFRTLAASRLQNPASGTNAAGAALLQGGQTPANTAPDMLQDNFRRPLAALGTRTVGQRDAPAAPFPTEEQLRVLGATLVGVGVFNTVNDLLQQPEVAKSLVENPLSSFINNIDLNPFSDQSVVQQRSSVEAAPAQQQYAPAYPQPVYQAQGYQQYAPQTLPAQPQ